SLDVQVMLFQIPIDPEVQKYFGFTWNGVQYIFTRFSQGYKHSPTLAQDALSQELENIKEIKNNPGVKIYQYIDDVMIGGHNEQAMRPGYDAIIGHLTSLPIEIPEEKRQPPSQETKFLGITWKGGTCNIPQDTLSHLGEIKVPTNRKELQEIMGTLQYWWKHIPDLSIIVRPLYDLLKNHRLWEWNRNYEEALKLLLLEAQTFQTLGPLHPDDP
ncbi:hypothetical protein N300_10734, partial [Calypte anna]